jgi:hypothetical protein
MVVQEKTKQEQQVASTESQKLPSPVPLVLPDSGKNETAGSLPVLKMEPTLAFAEPDSMVVQEKTKQEQQVALTESQKLPLVLHDSGKNETYVDCLAYNSKEWLEGPRFQNINETYMDPNFLRHTIVDAPFMLGQPGAARSYLIQTLAHESSRFVNDTDVRTDATSMRLWTLRLMYGSLLLQQHLPAIQEAKSRLNNPSCQSQFDSLGIGRFDFECPGSKYLVMGLNGNGLGYNVRSSMFQAFLGGLISNRIVIFAQRKREGWLLASCERRDYQCFFAPTSPCVPTMASLDNAYFVEKEEAKNLVLRGDIPKGQEDNKVWIMQPTLEGNRVPIPPKAVLDRFHQYSQMLLSHISFDDARRPVLSKAMDNIFVQDEPQKDHYYREANNKFRIALTIYSMRPNRLAQRQVNDILADVVLPGQLDPELSLGLPIRGE